MELGKKMECYAQICLKDGKQRFQREIGDFARVIALLDEGFGLTYRPTVPSFVLDAVENNCRA